MGVEKHEEMKPRNFQEEGNEAKIGPESTWLPHTKLLLEGKAADINLSAGLHSATRLLSRPASSRGKGKGGK